MKGQNVRVTAPMTLHDGKVVGVKEDSMQTDTMLLLVSQSVRKGVFPSKRASKALSSYPSSSAAG